MAGTGKESSGVAQVQENNQTNKATTGDLQVAKMNSKTAQKRDREGNKIIIITAIPSVYT